MEEIIQSFNICLKNLILKYVPYRNYYQTYFNKTIYFFVFIITNNFKLWLINLSLLISLKCESFWRKRWKFLRNTFGWEKSISDFEGISASIRKPISQAPLFNTWYTSLQNASHLVWCPLTDYSLVRAQPTAGRRLMYIILRQSIDH